MCCLCSGAQTTSRCLHRLMLSHIPGQAPKGPRNQSCKIGTESELAGSAEREAQHSDPSHKTAFGKGAGLHLVKHGHGKCTLPALEYRLTSQADIKPMVERLIRLEFSSSLFPVSNLPVSTKPRLLNTQTLSPRSPLTQPADQHPLSPT